MKRSDWKNVVFFCFNPNTKIVFLFYFIFFDWNKIPNEKYEREKKKETKRYNSFTLLVIRISFNHTYRNISTNNKKE